MKNSAFSLDHILHLSGNDRAFAKEVLEMFVDRAKADLETCQTLANSQKWDDVKFIAHRLRSSAGSVGAQSIASGCAELEKILAGTDANNQSFNDYLARFRNKGIQEIIEIESAIEQLKK